MPAPKGNKNAVGNEGGRPPIYDDPNELQLAVDSYFEYIKGEYHSEGDGDEEHEVCDREPERATITGLALHIGFESRSTIYEYEKKVEFSHIIKRAMLMVEKGYEMRLFGNNPTGAIFALKNMDWHDKSEVALSGVSLHFDKDDENA